MVLHFFGEFESDIYNEDKSQMKPIHREFDTCLKFPEKAMEFLFNPLISLIVSVEDSDISINCHSERAPHVSAFVCLADLANAADEVAIDMLFDFINQNMNNLDWQFRYASIFLES